MQEKFKLTLCCPKPRKDFAFGKGDHSDNELDIMKEYLKEAKGDIVVFPEGFLIDHHLEEAVSLVKEYGKWVVAGGQDSGERQSLYTLVIDPEKGVIYKHLKTALTIADRNMNCEEGKEIGAVDTPYGKIGTILCYEMHFPEVGRICAIEGAKLLVNTIGTGMWHEQQYDEWTTIAKARAIENRCFVVGCTHYCDPIPLMFAYDPHGRILGLSRNREGLMDVDIDYGLIDERDFMRDRNPLAYEKLCKEEIR